VADAVGSGDSFLASLISKLMEKADLQKAIDFAYVVGAKVATYSGANPIISHHEIEKFMKA
jgi:fructokinase